MLGVAVGAGSRDLLVGACSRLLAETNYELVLKPAYASRRPREAPPAEAP